MSASLRQSTSLPDARVALGASHGYRIDGDIAILHAELVIPSSHRLEGSLSRACALQLWACDALHDGMQLSGVKVAEAQLALPSADEQAVTHVEMRAFAQLPAGQRDYAMVMVLASGAPGAYDRVDDFANYEARQQFRAPCLEGAVGYCIEGDQIVLQADRVRNPRQADNLSGTLSLELWALPTAYQGGSFAGTRLAQVTLVPLAGQQAHEQVSARAPLHVPPAGTHQLTLMLREWTEAAGYMTRDYRTFASPYVAGAAPASRVLEPVASLTIVPTPTGARTPREASVAPKRTSARAPDAPRLVAVPPLSIETVARPSVQHASVAELSRVPGLNSKLAAAIVRARPLRSVDDLKRVRGIGDKLLRTLRAHVTL